MSSTTIRISKSVSWGDRRARLVLAVVLILPLLLVARPMPAASRAQPVLLTLADDSPDETVRVIVQKIGQGSAAEALVAELGGQITNDLSIINAFAAELSARAARELARSPLVRWVSFDSPVVGSETSEGGYGQLSPNTYLDTLGVRQVWNMGYDGTGVGVAIIDSGVSKDDDFHNLWSRKTFNPSSHSVNDVYGHGTHVAGIVAGSGNSLGLYRGMAPGARIISLKVGDENGMSYESDVVEAMQWALDNREVLNLRVVNLSVNSTVEMSYHESPMNAAAEILWFNGIVVVASVGNTPDNEGWSENTVNAAPANDPFIITAGASNENGDANRGNDTMASFSASGVSLDGHKRPDLIAPGKNIYSVLSKDSSWGHEYPDRCAAGCDYFRLSGSSMAAPMVSGAAALLLQAEPNLTPDQVKYRLVHASGAIAGGTLADGTPDIYPYLDVYAALTGTSTESANTGIEASRLLWTGAEPVTWDSVSWNSVSWSSVSWSSVSWSSVSWSSVSWASVSWSN